MLRTVSQLALSSRSRSIRTLRSPAKIQMIRSVPVRQSSTLHPRMKNSQTKNFGMGLLFGAASIGTAYFISTYGTVVDAEENTALNPNEFKKFKLSEVYRINHNTSLFRFQLDNPQQVLGLDVASCIVVRAPIGPEGKMVIRPYTPTSTKDQKGYFDLIIKNYPEGVMSKHIHSLKPGDYLEVKGPIAKIKYSPNMKKKIGMIAGGTGVTPMLQVIREALKDPNDKTEVTLVFANIAEEDILLRSEFDKLANEHKNFNVYYVLEKPPTGWNQGIGYVTANTVKEVLPPPSPDHMIFVCGPPPMMNAISGEKAKDKTQGELQGILKDLSYTSDQVYKF